MKKYLQTQWASNHMATMGFFLAAAFAVVYWIPNINMACFLLWPLALVITALGSLRAPRNLALIGLVLCALPLLLSVTVMLCFDPIGEPDWRIFPLLDLIVTIMD